MQRGNGGENDPIKAGGRRRGKRPADGPITREVVGSFLREYAELMPNSRHLRDRLAYRIVEYLANELALARIEKARRDSNDETKWQRAVGKV